MIDMYLYDDDESAQVQFVGFVGEHSRYDLMLVQTNRHFGKTIVLNMQTNKFGIIGTDDLEEEGYISYILGVNEDEGNEITEYLNEVIQQLLTVGKVHRSFYITFSYERPEETMRARTTVPIRIPEHEQSTFFNIAKELIRKF